MGDRQRPSDDDVAAIDLPVLIGAQDRREWKRARERMKLSARDFARLAHTTHGTVSNIESGVQPTLRRSAYISYLRAVHSRMSVAEATRITDEEIALTKATVMRIAKATATLDNEGLARAASLLELVLKH